MGLSLAVLTAAILGATAPTADVLGPASVCENAAAPLPKNAPEVPAGARKVIEAYRSQWRRACDPRADRIDLAELLGDAEALTTDVSLSRSLTALAEPVDVPDGSTAALRPSPTHPGVLSDGHEFLVDWSAFVAMRERGTAEDEKFWRAAALAATSAGAPAWVGADCVRIGEVSWLAVSNAISDMESAAAKPYARHGRRLREALDATLSALARGPTVCGCLKGDAAAGLEPLAATFGERVGTPTRRALARAAAAALEALRSGRVRVVWMRETREAPPTGCRSPAS